MASFTWDASLRQGVPFVSSMITVGAGNRACPASPLPGSETQANWCGSDELQFCPLTGAEGLLATAVLDELRPFPDTVMVSSCNPLTPAVADAPEGHGELGLCGVAAGAQPDAVQYWTPEIVAVYPAERGMPAVFTALAAEQLENAASPCCWMAAVASAEAVRTIVSKVTTLRCSPEPEIEVAKANRMASAAVPSTVRLIRISINVSPDSDRSRRRRSHRWAGVGPLMGGKRRWRLTAGSPPGTWPAVPTRGASPSANSGSRPRAWGTSVVHAGGVTGLVHSTVVEFRPDRPAEVLL